MSECKVFKPASEIEMLKRRIEQLERIVEEIRNPPVYGGYPKWCPPPQVGDQYWLNAPQASAVYQ
jgi:hypothetical protein